MDSSRITLRCQISLVGRAGYEVASEIYQSGYKFSNGDLLYLWYIRKRTGYLDASGRDLLHVFSAFPYIFGTSGFV